MGNIIILVIFAIAIRVALNKLQDLSNARYLNKKAKEQQKYAVAKGKEGEKAVNSVLSSLGKKYVLMKNILLKTNSGSTELDHVVVSMYGIFVIETKNYSGTVIGEDGYKNWKHYDRGGTERSFYNPIKQNAGHIGTLKRAINLNDDAFISVVVFAGSAELKIKSKTDVVQIKDLSKTIKSYNTKKFTKAEVKSIIKEIKSNNMDSIMARKQHIKHVKSKQT